MEELLHDILKTTAFEVGMFKANLSALCLEHGIDVSCIACTPLTCPKPWQDLPVLITSIPIYFNWIRIL